MMVFIFLDVSCVLWKNIEQSSKVMRFGWKITSPTPKKDEVYRMFQIVKETTQGRVA